MGNSDSVPNVRCGGDTTWEEEVISVPRTVTYPGPVCKNPTKVYGKPLGAVPPVKTSWHDGASAVDDPDVPLRPPLESKIIQKVPPQFGDEVLSVPRAKTYPSAACKNVDKVYGKPNGAMPADKSGWHGDGAVAAEEPAESS